MDCTNQFAFTLLLIAVGLLQNQVSSDARCNGFKRYWKQFQNSPDSISTINRMCNGAAEDSKANGDACYGCFSRALHNANNNMFEEITNCSTTYLVNTRYQDCAENFQKSSVKAIEQMNEGNCNAGSNAFCNFEQCVRATDKKHLLLDCIEEVQNASKAHNETDQLKIYTNTTACILAKLRCRGKESTNRNRYNSAAVQVLFVSSNYDLITTTLPHGVSSASCGTYTNIGLAEWPGEKCGEKSAN